VRLNPQAAFDLSGFARLNGPAGAPVAVALSGGGDSVALLHAARRWADGAGRRLIALTVDHGLSDRSAAWAKIACERAAALGVPARVLRWKGEKPAAGLQAKARSARHRLLAAAAREAGARVILLGHTADDVRECALMRAAGASVPSPRPWSPSPVWPEGRGVFLLRPLLWSRRAALRQALGALGEAWIEDPANDDDRFARTRARRRLAEGGADAQDGAPESDGPPTAPVCGLSEVAEGAGGELEAPRELFRGAGARALLGALCLCAAGGERPPRGEAAERLLARLAGPQDLTACLAGARIEARGGRVRFCREPGELVRVGLEPAPVALGLSVFDGRFELACTAPGWRVRPVRGIASRLARPERERLAALAPAVRAAAPAAIRGDETRLLLFDEDGPVRARPLSRMRLLAALGGVDDEASL